MPRPKRRSRQASTNIAEHKRTIVAASLPQHSFSLSSVKCDQARALEVLLLSPINFIPATALTHVDKLKTRDLRRWAAKKSKHETERKRAQRLAAAHIPNAWIPYSTTIVIEPASEISTQDLLYGLQRRGANSPAFEARGLANNGNKCYRNAALQGMFHQPAIAEWLRFHHLPADRNNASDVGAAAGTIVKLCQVRHCIACALHRLLVVYANCQTTKPPHFHQLLNDLHAELTRAHPHWDQRRELVGWHGLNTQEDTHELYLYLTNGFLAQLPDQKNMLRCIFSVKTNETFMCPYCGRISQYEVEENSILLWLQEIPGLRAVRLQDLLRNKFTDRREERSCRYLACETPGGTRDISFFISAAPDALTICLHRYGSWEGNGSKILREVLFPEMLDLSRYYQKKEPKSLLYQLVSVTSHIGSDLKQGHYFTNCKSTDGKWRKAVDRNIADGPLTPVYDRKRRRRSHSFDFTVISKGEDLALTAVLLFYSRIHALGSKA